MSIRCINPKYKFQWITREHVDTAFVLRQKIFAILAETEILDITAQGISESLARKNTGEVLGVADSLITEHSCLPLTELVGRGGRICINTGRRQAGHVLQRFAKPLGIGARGAE